MSVVLDVGLTAFVIRYAADKSCQAKCHNKRDKHEYTVGSKYLPFENCFSMDALLALKYFNWQKQKSAQRLQVRWKYRGDCTCSQSLWRNTACVLIFHLSGQTKTKWTGLPGL